MHCAVFAAILAASVSWDPVTVDVAGKPEIVVAGEIQISIGTTLVFTVPCSPVGGSFPSTGLAPGTYTICARVKDDSGNWSACGTTSYVVLPLPPPPPVPTKLVVTFSHGGLDLNGQALVLDRAELRIVNSGIGSSGTPIAIVAGTVPSVPGGAGLFVIASLSPGTFDSWARAHSKAGWSGYYGPVQIVWPPSQPQPIQVPIPLTVPARPNQVKVEAKP